MVAHIDLQTTRLAAHASMDLLLPRHLPPRQLFSQPCSSTFRRPRVSALIPVAGVCWRLSGGSADLASGQVWTDRQHTRSWLLSAARAGTASSYASTIKDQTLGTSLTVVPRDTPTAAAVQPLAHTQPRSSNPSLERAQSRAS